jgi:hypothetical protein
MVLTTLRRIAFACLLAVIACSPEREGDELFAPGGVGVLVVDALLVVGRPFGEIEIYLSETVAPNQPFSRESAGVDGATVIVEGGGKVFSFTNSGVVSGRYYLAFSVDTDVVLPSTTYNLSATLPDGRVLRATTTTPAHIDVSEWVLLDDAGATIQTLSTFEEDADTVYYQPENQLTYTQDILAACVTDQASAGYQIGLVSLDLGSRLLIDADFLEEEDLDDFERINSSPPLNYEATLRIPWLAIYYEGRYVLRVTALDRNWFDIVRTDPALGAGGFGFGGEAGDTSTRPIFHVEGGIGVFGSVSSDSVGFYVNPPTE